ncbi:MAG: energy-coupling factor ABC transporter ATP-binding protein [Deltaproteobacteria bacterium]|nr:energy-coupling factor ABC transporter ATP-binding protein [Deltaproteobacteria bacterium]
MSSPVLELRGIEQQRNGRTVLSVDEFSLNQGEVVGLAGPNGSGKSTLLAILCLLEAPVRGRVFLGGRQWDFFRAVPRDVTMLDQSPLLLKRSVRDNVAYGLRLRKVSGQELIRRVDESLSMVGLDPAVFAGRSWMELSGGEGQRVALAARLALRPRVLLLDEPTASLDEDSANLVQEAVIQARQEWGTSLVIASHDLDWLQTVADRMVRLRRGKIVEDFRPT